ncbi:hypothetical protein BH10PSE6_BH10PSE6_32960 [soil metagenome]
MPLARRDLLMAVASAPSHITSPFETQPLGLLLRVR